MTNTIQLVIVSQDKKIFSGEVDHVSVTAEQGELGIYPKHSPLIARLRPGIVSFKTSDNQDNAIYISGGFIEIQPNIVSILADVAIYGEELNKERILAAKAKAEASINTADTAKFNEISVKIQKEMAKLKAYELMNSFRERKKK